MDSNSSGLSLHLPCLQFAMCAIFFSFSVLSSPKLLNNPVCAPYSLFLSVIIPTQVSVPERKFDIAAT